MATEIAAALILAVGAGLLVRSLVQLTKVELGFRTDGVLVFTMRPPDTRYRDPAARVAFFQEVERRIESIAGVQSVAVASEFPMRGGWRSRLMMSGDSTRDKVAGFQAVSPGYFTALGIPLVRGRLISAADRQGAPLVAVVSETFARRFVPSQDALGHRFRIEPDAPEITVIGVVREVRRDGKHAALTPQVFLSAAQSESYDVRLAEVGVRATADPYALVPAIQRAIWAVDPDQPITNVQSLDDVVSGWMAGRRFNMLLLGALAALAVGLALVGVYGVVAHAAAQRTREIGIRIALGAGRRDVIWLVVASGVKWALAGVATGLAGAYVGSAFMTGLLFGIPSTDVTTFAAAAALTIGVALVASYIPARRAASTDPVSALRGE